MTSSQKYTLAGLAVVLGALLFSQKQKIVETITGKFSITPARKAFLKMVNWAEGSPGYNQLFDYIPFNNLAPHPNLKIPFGNTYTTAAGAYQFLYSTWQNAIKKLGVTDYMSAENQDQAALQLISDRGALSDVDQGNIESAINKVSYEWASLPPGRYSQNYRSLPDLIAVYNNELKNG